MFASNVGYIYLDDNPFPRENGTLYNDNPLFEKLSSTAYPNETFVLRRIDTVPVTSLLFQIQLVESSGQNYLRIQDTEDSTNFVLIPFGQQYINMFSWSLFLFNQSPVNNIRCTLTCVAYDSTKKTEQVFTITSSLKTTNHETIKFIMPDMYIVSY
jgi:hypothetical protein